ncbi:hypothetical protein Afil01_27330 [Actinorhabdospora filicis]|uniref:Uncharacterized protein n=1 Tax=Actinorhabdospora filicis TaxID=1785913 RepID=A0A9W6SLF0_9ACTN|nr:hypothetical protein [Actinorhabdospora filicis]GLZ77926.1 hypothetical protein Afil01_27330 [Actinorhabdospora filicis]
MVVQTEGMSAKAANAEIDQVKERATTLLARALLVGSSRAGEVFNAYVDALVAWEDAKAQDRPVRVERLRRAYELFG